MKRTARKAQLPLRTILRILIMKNVPGAAPVQKNAPRRLSARQADRDVSAFGAAH